MITIGICDEDEKVVQELECIFTQVFGHEMHVEFYKNAKNFLLYIEDNAHEIFDIIFLNVKIGKEDGIAIAEQIQKKYFSVPVIFVSDSIDFIQDIFQADPAYFLVKPFVKEKVREALEIAVNVLEKKGGILRLGSRLVSCRDITYIESEKRMLFIHKSDEIIKVYMKMSDLEKQMPGAFLRCHQSYMVNMKNIKSFSKHGLLLTSGEKIPVSRSRYQEAKRIFFNSIK